MKRFAVFGGGRMAEALCAAASVSPAVEIVAVVSRSRPAWADRVPFHHDLDDLAVVPDTLIDFSLPAGTLVAARWCHDAGVPLLSGVTGLDPDGHQQLALTARHVPVLWAANLSIGVNLLAGLCEQAARHVPAGTTVAIHEVHHSGKKDAPSGTALMLGEAIAALLPPATPAVAYHPVREGDVVGQHRVVFDLAGETLELGHAAHDRGVFAAGALAAASWLSSRPAGLYRASDWLFGPTDPGR